jgi:hypothetical protein
MAKHRHKSYDGNDMHSSRPIGTMNNNPFGINPQQLLAMLGGNMDMSGLGNLLSSMNKNGFDLSSLNNLNNFNVTNNNPNNNNNATDNNATNSNNPTPHKKKSSENKNLDSVEDENIQFLKSLRKIVDINKIEFIDRIIELYNKGAFKDNSE